MTSTFVPGDMEFFNVQIQATRPDGNDLVPFWVTTKENLVCLFTLMLILILFLLAYLQVSNRSI